MNHVKYVPNILSIIRIVLSIWMTVIWDDMMVFFIVILVCGLTDVLDGYLARKWRVTSSLGAFLDSLSDLIFFLILLFWTVFHSSLTISMANGGVLGGIFMIRLANIFITKLKFDRFGMIHTLLNKITGAMYFLLVLLLIFYPVLANRIVSILLGIALISAVEESIILIKSKQYEVNKKTIFGAPHSALQSMSVKENNKWTKFNL